jgi:hypothetical protein
MPTPMCWRCPQPAKLSETYFQTNFAEDLNANSNVPALSQMGIKLSVNVLGDDSD